MKVLLTGATGFVGSWIARELVGRGHAVRALLRATSKRDNVADLKLETAEGEVNAPGTVRRALEGCDAVVHTAGVVGWQDADLYKVNVEGTRTVLGVAAEAGVRRAIHTSSSAAIGGADEPKVLDETSPYEIERLGLDYMNSKWRGEQVALELHRERRLPVVILNPVVVLGPGDIYRSSTATVLAIARRRMPAYVSGGAAFCDVRDVARAHADALEGRGRPGERYILGGHNLRIEDFVARVAAIAGVKPPRRLPYAIAWLAALVMERFGSELNRQLLRASALYTWVSSAKAEKELCYKTRPFEESVRDTLRFFAEKGKLALPAGFAAAADAKAKVPA